MIRYYLHDHHQHAISHCAELSEIQVMLSGLRWEAEMDMKAAGTAHAVYAVKQYDPESGDLLEVDMFDPAIFMDDDEFRKRTEEECRNNPGCIVLAVHAKT